MSAALAEAIGPPQQRDSISPALRIVAQEIPSSMVDTNPIHHERRITKDNSGKGKEKNRTKEKIHGEIIPGAVRFVDPPKDLHPSHAREVLENAYRVGAQEPEKNAGIRLVDTIRENPRVTTVVCIGPPGSGKSTFIEQLIEEMFVKAGGEISMKITSFDPAFQEMVQEVPRELWEKVHWKFINNSLILTSKNIKKDRKNTGKRIHPAREIEIIEVPFVGNKETSDRGRSYVEHVWVEARAHNEEDGVIFVPFAPVAPMLERSGSFREEIKQAKTIAEQVAILTKYGIEIAKDIVKNAGKKAKELLEKIIQQITQSATKKQQEIVGKDVQAAMREELPYLHPDFLREFIPLPNDLRLTKDAAYQLRRYIFYWEQTLDQMGVPSQQRHILVNAPLPRIHRVSLGNAA